TSSVPYQISPHGTYRATLERSGDVVAGYAVVTPEPGTTTPSGTAIFQVKRDGIIVTEAGVAASPSTTAARILVDNAGSSTGVALANRENQPAAVSFALLDINGRSVATTTRNLPPRGHLAIFAHELFPDVPQIRDGFTGLLEIASSAAVALVTLRLTINQRDDLIFTTLPVADLNRPTPTALVFPQVAIGEGFSTRLILINSKTGIAASGRLSFFRSDGSAMTVPFGTQIGSQFPYYLPRVGSLPGNTARIASIVVLDPSTNLITSEIAVNEGNTVRARLLVLDTTGTPRDDFHLSYTS